LKYFCNVFFVFSPEMAPMWSINIRYWNSKHFEFVSMVRNFDFQALRLSLINYFCLLNFISIHQKQCPSRLRVVFIIYELFNFYVFNFFMLLRFHFSHSTTTTTESETEKFVIVSSNARVRGEEDRKGAIKNRRNL
jgi:hypothetical protein